MNSPDFQAIEFLHSAFLAAGLYDQFGRRYWVDELLALPLGGASGDALGGVASG
jgi:hypothetical protein